jgi:hypothetical protein
MASQLFRVQAAPSRSFVVVGYHTYCRRQFRRETPNMLVRGTRVSPSTVSNLNKNASIEAWRMRPIEAEHQVEGHRYSE